MTIGRLPTLRAARQARDSLSPWLQALALASPAAVLLWMTDPALIPYTSGVWVQAALAAWVCIAGWDVLRRGLCEACFYCRVTQDGLSAVATLAAVSLSFTLAVLATRGTLAAEIGGTMTSTALLFGTAAAVLTSRLVGRALAERWDSSAATSTRQDTPRLLPRAARVLLVLGTTLCVSAGLFACAMSGSLTTYNVVVVWIAVLAGMNVEGIELTLWRGRLRPIWKAASQTDTILFERSGVLTAGQPTVTTILPLREGVTEARVAHLATVAEFGIDHPLRDALLRLPHSQTQTIPNLKRREQLSGKGIVAQFGGQRLLVGNLRLLEHSEWNTRDLERLSEETRPLWQQGNTVLFVCLGDEAIGAIAFRDALRPAAGEALAALDTLGIETGLITGDVAQSSAALAREHRLTHLYAGLSEDKVREQLDDLAAAGKTVALVRLAGAVGIDNLQIRFLPPGHDADDVLEFEAVSVEEVAHRIIQSRLTARRRRHRLIALAAYHVLLLPLLCGAYYPWLGFPPAPSFAAWTSVAVNWLLLRPSKFDRLTNLA